MTLLRAIHLAKQVAYTLQCMIFVMQLRSGFYIIGLAEVEGATTLGSMSKDGRWNRCPNV